MEQQRIKRTYPFRATAATGTSAPDYIVWLDLVQDALGLGLGLDFFDAANQDIEPALLLALAQLLDGGDLLLGADDAGNGPGLLKEERREELADLAVAAEDEDVLAHAWIAGQVR